MSYERPITKELVLKAHRRYCSALKRITSGLLSEATLEAGIMHHSSVARTYIVKLKSGRLVFYYRVGKGQRFAKISIGSKIITLTSNESKKQYRAAIPTEQE